jgi:hypothetical protein
MFKKLSTRALNITMNYRLIIVAAATLMTTTTTFAQFGGLLNTIKNKVEQVQKETKQTPGSTQPVAVPEAPALPGGILGLPAAAPAAATAASPVAPAFPGGKPAVASAHPAGDIRQKWLSDPFPDIPREVTDQDIRDTTFASVNKIFLYLNSPVIAKAYKQCQSAEEARIGARGAELRQASNAAKSNTEKTQLLDQAKSIESIKGKIAPTTCLLRVVRRATLELNLEFFGTQPKYGMKSPDEQFTVVQLFKVARALEKNEFKSDFHSAMGDEISINYNEWIDKYLVKVSKANVEEMKKKVPASDRKAREQFDSGAEMGVARRVEFYNQVVNTVAEWISSGALKP